MYVHTTTYPVRYWISACINATKSGYVDGCFSDSSSVDTHKTAAHLNDADHAAFEFGKVQSMTELYVQQLCCAALCCAVLCCAVLFLRCLKWSLSLKWFF